MTRDPTQSRLFVGRVARASWLRARAIECVRQADEAKAIGELLEAMAFLCLGEEYAKLAELRAVEEAADG